jgi:hypothetical protein
MKLEVTREQLSWIQEALQDKKDEILVYGVGMAESKEEAKSCKDQVKEIDEILDPINIRLMGKILTSEGDLPTKKFIQKEIGHLVTRLWKLTNPTDEEVRDAQENLTEDPMNTLPELIYLGDDVSNQLILDEIIAAREMEREDEANARKRLGPKKTKVASSRKSKNRRD